MKKVIALLLLCWVGGVCAGLFFGQYILVIFFIIGLILVLLTYRWSSPVITAAASLIALGCVYGSTVPVVPQSPCSGSGDVEGRVVSVENKEGSTAQYRVQADDCLILLTSSRFPEYYVGNHLRMQGGLQLVEEIPEQYVSYGEYLSRQGISATMRYADIEITSNQISVLERIRITIQRQVTSVLYEPEAGVVQAMLLGERGGISDELTEQFRRSGVSHIIAISGLHISLIAAMLLFVSSVLPLPRSTRFLGILIALWIYVILVGAPPSAVRAGVFWSITLIALTTHRLVSLPTILIMALMGIITISPTIAREVGFQLSVAAVVGIGMMLTLIRPWFDHIVHIHSFYAVILSVLAVSVGAQLATWPLIALYFEQVSVFGFIANVLIVPIVPLFLIGAIITLLMSYIFPPIAYLGGGLLHGIWVWINMVSGNIARFPLNSVSFEPSWGAILVYYLLLVVGATIWLRKNDRSWREVWQ